MYDRENVNARQGQGIAHYSITTDSDTLSTALGRPGALGSVYVLYIGLRLKGPLNN